MEKGLKFYRVGGSVLTKPKDPWGIRGGGRVPVGCNIFAANSEEALEFVKNSNEGIKLVAKYGEINWSVVETIMVAGICDWDESIMTLI